MGAEEQSLEEGTLKSEWDNAFDRAQDVESPTFTETMNVSVKEAEEIEKYIAEKGEQITSEERDFLNLSIKMKNQSAENRAEEAVQIEQVRSDIEEVQNKSMESEESGSNEKLVETISALKEGMEILKIDPETKIRLDNENSDMWKKKYQFTDKKSSNLGVVGLLFGKNKERIEFYEMLGNIASQNGIDMNEGKSVAEIILLLEKKVG